jgi:hypothetical protein
LHAGVRASQRSVRKLARKGSFVSLKRAI